MIFPLLKKLIKKLPFSFTKNQRYDAWTREIVNRYCEADSNCVDVGTHKGEILDVFLKKCPQGIHFGFEPLPELFLDLEKKYKGLKNCRLFCLALSNGKGTTAFNHVVSNPAYSGIKKRRYDRAVETDETIDVKKDRMDNILPADLPIRLIKIDVEGGELDVLEGAENILASYKPLIIFECGLGGSDVYGTTPGKMLSFLTKYGYRVYLLDDFLKERAPLSAEGFNQQFYGRRNYYFLAA